MLLEREQQLARVSSALAAARGGSGSLLVVEGPAGIGKSTVLRAARTLGQARGCTGLAAVAGEFERGFGFGVVRQLFEPTVRGMKAGGQRELFAGAAELVRPLLLPSARAASASTIEPAAVMHGLYWLAANLAEDRPLLVSVDDAQWCDVESLAWLLYLARRLDDLAVLLIVAVRGGEPDVQGGVLAALADSDLGERLPLLPLSYAASARLAREGWDATVDDDACRACFEVTGGNPFLLRELTRAVAAEASRPGVALAERVRALTPRTVARSVIARLRRLPDEAEALARALAVLGGRAAVRELIALAGIDHETGMGALDALAREQIASGRPVHFVHPLVGSAIYAEVPPATRSRQHARAARMLAASGAGPARIASQLLHAELEGDEWATAVLRTAAREALRDGAPKTAVRWLVRALDEPPVQGERALVLHELGAAELLAGPTGSGSDSRAELHLREAVRRASDPRARALAALDWGDALWATHRYVEAVQAFDHGIEAARGVDIELALRIEAHAAAAARLDLGTCALVSRRLERFGSEPPATPAGQLIAGVLAIDRALAGEPVDRVLALAERMLEAGRLPRGRMGAQIPLFAANALLWCDRLEEARRLLDEMIAAAQAVGSARGVIIALCWRAAAKQRSGALAEAASDLATAVELAAGHSSGGTVVTHAFLAEVLLERGDASGADQALSPVEPPAELPDYVGWNYFLHARGAVSAAKLDLQSALEDFLACGVRQQRWVAPNPSVIAWRSQAALVHLALGNRAEALELAGEELQLARSFGAPRAIGNAARTLGLIETRDRQLALLHEAVSVLERTPARLDHARALADLGGALRRSNQRAAAREPLGEALDLATRCGAILLADRVRNELLATGARPRKPIRTGIDALTPIERQTASMAAEGMSNPQIAQALFISRKTVEKRLSDAYRKLDIRSRNELTTVLTTQNVNLADRQALAATPSPEPAG